MKARIQVEKESEDVFRVTVNEGGSQTTHQVTVADAYYRKLTEGRTPAAELVRLSFEFLLAREPKESILARFELPLIGHYFPEYEREIKKRLRQ